MQPIVLIIFLPLALLHLWFVYRRFVSPPGQTAPMTFAQALRNYATAAERTRLFFWVSTGAVLLLAALLQLS